MPVERTGVVNGSLVTLQAHLDRYLLVYGLPGDVGELTKLIQVILQEDRYGIPNSGCGSPVCGAGQGDEPVRCGKVAQRGGSENEPVHAFILCGVADGSDSYPGIQQFANILSEDKK